VPPDLPALARARYGMREGANPRVA